jgi:hypothetical protein
VRQAEKQGGGKPAPVAEAPAPRKRAARTPVAPTAKAAPNGEPDLIEAMEARKPLVASLGAERVKRLVDLLG